LHFFGGVGIPVIFGYEVTDMLTITKLVWDLYHKCFFVARNAPDEFNVSSNSLIPCREFCVRFVTISILTHRSWKSWGIIGKKRLSAAYRAGLRRFKIYQIL
jgi:hypothetical protein